jgi:hypothetical protein
MEAFLRWMGSCARPIALVALMLLAASAGCQTAPKTGAEDQKLFASPDQAFDTLLAALRDNDTEALLDLFGRQAAARVVSRDAESAAETRRRVYTAAQERRELRWEGDSEVHLVIGSEDWTFPFPLIRDGADWRFDTETGLEEIENRIVGENELNAISVCRAFLEAQPRYASADRDGDGVLEYAQKILSSPGARDGLYWDETSAPDGEESPFGPFLAEAGVDVADREPGEPYFGYYFKLLKRQGSNAPGGAKEFLVGDNMTAGFAILAFPADHGVTGVMTFIASHHGAVLQKDLGAETAKAARELGAYDPDPAWSETKD